MKRCLVGTHHARLPAADARVMIATPARALVDVGRRQEAGAATAKLT